MKQIKGHFILTRPPKINWVLNSMYLLPFSKALYLSLARIKIVIIKLEINLYPTVYLNVFLAVILLLLNYGSKPVLTNCYKRKYLIRVLKKFSESALHYFHFIAQN